MHLDTLEATMIAVPSMADHFKIVLIDGVNIGRARPMRGRVVFEDLLGCVQSLENGGMRVCVILDDTRDGKDAQHFLKAKSDFTWTWLCRAADPVLLELAKRLDYSAILSRDDFAEFQDQYAIVLFDPKRTLTFDYEKGVIQLRTITEKYRQQITYDPICDFVSLLDIILTVGDLSAAEQLCSDVNSLSTVYKAEQRPLHAAITFASTLVHFCLGQGPGWVDRLRFSFEMRTLHRTRDVHWPCADRVLLQLPLLLRHVRGGGKFADVVAEQRLSQLCMNLSRLSREDAVHEP